MPQPINPLQPPDSFHLSAAEGWLGLDNPLEAHEELEKISPILRSHPAVLAVRWQIYAKEERWEDCVNIARALTALVPTLPEGWIHLAYATRRAPAGGLEKAQTILLAAIEKFPKVSLFPYNLACYACQLGKLAEARQWLERAFEIGDARQLKLMALADTDLKLLCAEISKW